jgi:hypothetical protein
MEKYLRVNLLGPVPRLMKKKKNYRAAVSRRLRNIALKNSACLAVNVYRQIRMLNRLQLRLHILP